MHVRDDRGDVVGWALVAPLLMLLTVGGVQTALWFQARSVCQGAAAAGVRQARVLNAIDGAGASAAHDYLARVGDGSVTNTRTTESTTPTSVTVTCTGHAQRVIPLPGLSITVHQSATAPRERFTVAGP